MKYIAGKHGLAKKEVADRAIEDQIENELIDLRNRIVKIAYQMKIRDNETKVSEFQKLSTEFKEAIKNLDSFVGNNKFLTGNELSYVDFLGYEYLDWFRALIDDKIYDQASNIERFFKNFEALPNLKDYLASKEYRRAPIFSPFANFGFTRD